MKPRKYITKSRSGHYTATVRSSSGERIWKEKKLSSAYEANQLADKFLDSLPQS